MGGYNLFRYSVIIMGGVGGFFLGNIAYDYFLADSMGEGVLRSTSGSAGVSFIIAFVMLAAMALAYAFYNIMAPIIAAVGAGFMFSTLAALTPGAGYGSNMIGFFFGVIVGALFGVAAVQFQKWVAILFTSMCGARIVAYAGAKLLLGTSIATTVGSPVANALDITDSSMALELALFLELFVIVTVVGFVIQYLTRGE